MIKKSMYCQVVLLFCFSLVLGEENAALVIGHNEGLHGMNPLKYAEKESRKVGSFLREYCAVDSENMIQLTHCTAQEMDQAIVSITSLKGSKKIDKFFIYYSGHGDESDFFLGNERYSLKKIHDLVTAGIGSVTIAIFDACHTGSLTTMKGARKSIPFYLSQDITSQAAEGYVILAASAPDETAMELDMIGGSLFTFHLLNGLLGSADISQDEKVSISECFLYAQKKTIETSAYESAAIQHPSYRFSVSGSKDIILTDFSKIKKQGIVIGSSISGQCLVLEEKESNIYADFYKPEMSAPRFISLPAGQFTFIAAGRSASRFASFSIDSKAKILTLESKDLSVFKRRSKLLKGDLDEELSQPIEEKPVAPLKRSSYGFGGGIGQNLSAQKATVAFVVTRQYILLQNEYDFISSQYLQFSSSQCEMALDCGFQRRDLVSTNSSISAAVGMSVPLVRFNGAEPGSLHAIAEMTGGYRLRMTEWSMLQFLCRIQWNQGVRYGYLSVGMDITGVFFSTLSKIRIIAP